ncbi:hypothetical protein [Delftia lacustris]
MAFEIEEFTNARLASINVRSEKHGPDHLEPAVDLAFQIDAANSILSAFDGHLLNALYHRSEAAAGDGKSSRTRMALLAVMVAMEADNAADPGRDWWAERNGAAQAQQTGQ